MPELPEVETIRLSLSKQIVGMVITDIKVLAGKSFEGDPRAIISYQVKNLWRRGKVLGIDLQSRGEEIQITTLLIHLKMSGQLIFEGKVKIQGGHPTKDMLGKMPNKSTRVIFEFNWGAKLFFNDQRRFGWIKLIKNKDLVLENRLLKKMGPEPIEKNFTWEILRKRLQRRKNTPVKSAILDQEVVAGVGNIYACETLFLARINPLKRVSELSLEEFKRLHRSMIKVLNLGIKYGGSTKTHFVDSTGKKGSFLDFAQVYDRENEPCKRCGGVIAKIKIAGRGTYFCSVCQI